MNSLRLEHEKLFMFDIALAHLLGNGRAARAPWHGAWCDGAGGETLAGMETESGRHEWKTGPEHVAPTPPPHVFPSPDQLISSSSMSKTNVAFGAIIGAAPRSPYASSGGTTTVHLAPTGISWRISVHPGMTRDTGNRAGSLRE